MVVRASWLMITTGNSNFLQKYMQFPPKGVIDVLNDQFCDLERASVTRHCKSNVTQLRKTPTKIPVFSGDDFETNT